MSGRCPWARRSYPTSSISAPRPIGPERAVPRILRVRGIFKTAADVAEPGHRSRYRSRRSAAPRRSNPGLTTMAQRPAAHAANIIVSISTESASATTTGPSCPSVCAAMRAAAPVIISLSASPSTDPFAANVDNPGGLRKGVEQWHCNDTVGHDRPFRPADRAKAINSIPFIRRTFPNIECPQTFRVQSWALQAETDIRRRLRVTIRARNA